MRRDGWFPVKGYEDKYEISVAGAVRNTKSRRLLSPVGRQYVLSSKGGTRALRIDELRDSSIPKDMSFADLLDLGTDEVKVGAIFDPLVVAAATDSTALIGAAGEHLVCFELSLRGVMSCCNVVPGAPYDVIGDFGGGRLFKIQVKTTARPRVVDKYPNAVEEYRFKNLSSATGSVDAYAFVSLSQRAVVLEVPEGIKGDSRVFASEASFMARAGRSIDELLPVIYSRVKR